MEATQGLGTIGSAKESLSAGVVEIDLTVKVDLAGELQKKVDAQPDGWQKSALTLAITALKQLG